MAQNQVLDQLLDSLPQLLLGMRQINVDEMKIMREMDQEDRRVSLEETKQSKELDWGQATQDQNSIIFSKWLKNQEVPEKFVSTLMDITKKNVDWKRSYRKHLGESNTWGDRAKRFLLPKSPFGGFEPLSDEKTARERTKAELGYDKPQFDYNDVPEDVTLEQFTRISSHPLFRNLFMDDDLMKVLLQQQVMGGGLGLMGGTTGLQDPYGFGR